MKIGCGLLAVLLLLPAASAAQDDGVRGRWSVTLSGGAAPAPGGEFHQGGTGTVLGLPTNVQAKNNDDVFDPALGWQAGVGFGVTRNVELFTDFTWKRAEAKAISVGDVATLDLRAAFGDYKSYGMEAGMRYHFGPGAPLNPYLSLLGGFRRVEAIPGTFSVPAAGVTLRDTPFFDDSTVPVFGGNLGLLVGVSQRVSLGVEGGLRYHGDLSEIEGLAGTGLENLNDAGSRWSLPISAVVRIGF